MTLKPIDIAEYMRIPGYKRVYGILPGLDGDPVSFHSQQRRAFNLAWSLAQIEVLRPGTKVSVIGGGLAGVTMAAAARMLRCDVTLLEAGYYPFHQQRGNHTRYIHPNLIDWPEERADLAFTELPFLNWNANLCYMVVREIEVQWKCLASSVNFQRSKIVTEVKENDQVASVIVERPYGKWPSDVVIVCVGLGRERQPKNVSPKLYWEDDKLHQAESVEGKRLLISGVGDGGLIDAMRALFHDFDHGRLLETVVRHQPLEAVKGEILDIERKAKALRQGSAGSFIETSYDTLRVAEHLPETLKARVRRGSDVWLNAEADSPLDLRASVLNRVIIYGLMKWGHVNYVRGKLSNVDRTGPPWKVTFRRDKSEFTRDYDEIIVRHGPVGGFTELFNPDTIREFRNASAAIKATSRIPFWDDQIFDPVPPSQDYLDLMSEHAGRYRGEFKESLEKKYGASFSLDVTYINGHPTYLVKSAKPLNDLPPSFAHILVVKADHFYPPERMPNQPPWLTMLPIEPKASIREPTGIAIDGNNVYVTDHSLGTLMRIDDGRVVASRQDLNRPHHIAAVAGKSLVTDTHNKRSSVSTPP
jgi:hypothetical protein